MMPPTASFFATYIFRTHSNPIVPLICFIGQFIPGKGMRNREDELLAVNNPALETFKGGKKTKGTIRYQILGLFL